MVSSVMSLRRSFFGRMKLRKSVGSQSEVGQFLIGVMLSTILTAAAVEKPVFVPSASDSATALDVAITCPTAGVGIRYTLNGEDPTTSDPFIRSGSTIRIARTAILKARAWDGGVPSDVAEEEFRITGGIAVGNQHALALSVAGRVWSWGNQANGRLGNGASNSDEQVHPVQVSGSGPGGYFEDGLQMAGGHLHSLLLDERGDVWAFGENYYGALGDNSTTDSSVPIQVLKSTTAGDFLGDCVGVAAGERFSLALSSTGEVFSWGYQGNGRLGNGSTAGTQRYALPVLRGDDPAYPALTGIRQIAAGATFGYAREANEMEEPGSLGKVWVWGLNLNGQLGQGNSTTQSRAVPMKLTGGADLTGAWSISGGESHTAIVRWDPNDPALLGTVWTCGNRSFGRLGQGSTSAGSVKYPDLVVKADSSPLAGIVQVASGAAHSLAVDQDGRVWAWGYNGYGQLGNGTTTNSGVAVKVKNPAGTSDLENIVAVAAGGDGSQGASMALAEDGTIYVWGRNNKGQLGNGEVTNYATVLPIAHAQNHVAEYGPSIGLTHSIISDIAPGEVSLTATPAHSGPGGVSNIQRVDFYFGGKWIKTLSGPPWTVTASDLTAGDHHAYAIVYDNEGVTAMSPSISVTIDPSLSDDPDGDGLTTEFELTTSNTDPTNPDTDGDGMEDGYEQWNGFSPLSLELGTSNASYGDADGDGVTNKAEHDTGRLAKVWNETYIQEELTDDLLRLFVRKGFITSVEYSTNLANWSVYPRAFDGRNLEETINLNDWSAVDLSLGRGFFRLRWESVTEDQDGDGMPDLWEAIYNLDVTDDGTINPELGPDGDIDGDGLSNLEEYEAGTNPTKWDTDGDGISDGGEVGGGASGGGSGGPIGDPLDPNVTPNAEWLVVVGDSVVTDSEGNPVQDENGNQIPAPKHRAKTIQIPKGESRLVVVAAFSAEYIGFFTARQSDWNDTIAWDVAAPGEDAMSGSLNVNELDDEWTQSVAATEAIRGFAPATVVEAKTFTAPSQFPLDVVVNLTVTNVNDTDYNSVGLVGVLPVKVSENALARPYSKSHSGRVIFEFLVEAGGLQRVPRACGRCAAPFTGKNGPAP